MSPPLRLGSSRPRPLWVGTRVGRGGGVEPIRAVSLRPPFPTPSPPAFRAASCAAPAQFGAAARGAGRLCDSGRSQGGGNPTEELREEGEDSDLHLEPVKASGGVLGGGGRTPTVARLTAFPDPRPWQPGKEEATRS